MKESVLSVLHGKNIRLDSGQARYLGAAERESMRERGRGRRGGRSAFIK